MAAPKDPWSLLAPPHLFSSEVPFTGNKAAALRQGMTGKEGEHSRGLW